MHQSEVRKRGLGIIKDIYFMVLESRDKGLWKDAIDSMHQHIADLETRVRRASAEDWEDANFLVTELWAWKSARRQMCSRFGRLFILPNSCHEERPDEPL